MHPRLVVFNGRLAAIPGSLAAIVLLGAACGASTQSQAGTSPAPVAASPSPAAAAATIAVANDSKLGQILVDGSGRTVYLFVADTGTTSTCYTSCAQIWPPVLTTGAPQAGAGTTASLLGTTARTDGTTEVTFAGHPLYYFASDKKPGDTTGQAVNSFGALWYVLSPAGMQIS
jgi:predicted lipoprotein with Yx(FWY)xxD motif